MVFNWFRRKFDDGQDKEDLASAENLAEKLEEIDQPIPSEPTAPTQDLLNWAKTAYANIQAREDVPPLQIEKTEIILENTSEPITDEVVSLELTDLKIAEVGLSDVDTNLAVKSTENVINSVDESVDKALEDIPETPEQEVLLATEALPFWAVSDRQARIAELNANAILEPVQPEILNSDQIKEAELSVEQEFLDEGFLWSSEILANQGRRPQDISVEEIAWLKRLRQGLDKTRLSLVNQLKSLVGKGPLNAEAVDEIEALLLQADVGVKATDAIIQKLQVKIRDEVLPPDQAIAFLKELLREMLEQPFKNNKTPQRLAPEKNQLNVWLITGVNGAGKTTTIGKLARLAKNSGYSTLIAAADTFRAAAVQQVQVWGDRSGVEVIANIGKNTDPAAVVFDAIASAQSRGTELLLVDTAGRLQNKQNLMDELSKIRRIVDKKATGAKIESLLVLDSTLGQNGLKQAEVFSKSAGISGVILTKLDGTAKGGVAIAVVQQLGLPIRFIGAGEGIDDLRPFSSYEFIEALLSN